MSEIDPTNHSFTYESIDLVKPYLEGYPVTTTIYESLQQPIYELQTDLEAYANQKLAQALESGMLRILTIDAHPDDTAYSQSGFIIEAVHHGNHIRAITTTIGQAGAVGTAVGRRKENARSYARMGVNELDQWEFLDGQLSESTQLQPLRGRLIAEISQYQPHLILSLDNQMGKYHHPDHLSISNLFLDGDSQHTPLIEQLGIPYLGGLSTQTQVRFPQVLIPQKLAVVEAHQSQLRMLDRGGAAKPEEDTRIHIPESIFTTDYATHHWLPIINFLEQSGYQAQQIQYHHGQLVFYNGYHPNGVHAASHSHTNGHAKIIPNGHQHQR